MVKVVRLYEFGGPDVLKVEDAEIGNPEAHEILLEQTAIGINFNEILLRQGAGSFPPSDFPVILGREAAGIVQAVGSGVEQLKIGDRVAYGMGGLGGYAEARLIPAARVVKLPDQISEMQAASIMVKGLTSYYLLHQAYSVQPGDHVLIHVATGGVGRILCQWAKHMDAIVIGSVSRDDKKQLALDVGCHHVINSQNPAFDEEVLELTGGTGVHAVYDPIGQQSFVPSLKSLRVRGSFVAFGDLSGRLEPIDPHILMEAGSIRFIRTSLRHFISTRQELDQAAEAVFSAVIAGHIEALADQTYKLQDTARAHADMEERRVSGTTILVP